MATSYPASLDSFTNPTAVDTLDSPPHDTQHADANDAIEALQAKVGVDGSAVTTSLDYKVANLESRPVETKTASYVLVAADVNKRIVMNSASATTITVNTGIFSAGDTVWIHNIGAGTTTVTAGTATVNTAGSLELAQWGGGALYFTSASTGIFFPAGGVSGIEVDFLIIGGGGSGRNIHGGGGGAGGYITTYASESSGGGGPNYDAFRAATGTNYAVNIGAGGTFGSRGGATTFGYIGAAGGGGGYGLVGGSGAGAPGGTSSSGFAGYVDQGYDGGANIPDTLGYNGGGGGGAGGVGGNASSTAAGAGGAGLSSNITGSAVTRAGGGGGGCNDTDTVGTGGSGGGGNGGNNAASATSGTANTGGGGGGGGYGSYTSPGNGGSGVLILRYPNTYTITLGAGLTGSTATDGSDKVTTITAGADYVSWS
jgi:hypothetical protein